MIVLALVGYFLISAALALYIRYCSDPANHEFWHMERTRLNRAVLVLAIAVTVQAGIPLQDFESRCRRARG